VVSQALAVIGRKAVRVTPARPLQPTQGMRPLVLSAVWFFAACSSAPATSPGPADSGTDAEAPTRDSAAPVADGSTPSADAGGGTDAAPPSIDAGPITGLNGATYYVSASTGDDKNAGTSRAAPWKTIQNAGNVVKPGDTVVVLAGTYDAPIFGWNGAAPCGTTADCLIAGTSAHPILFEADPTATAGSVVIAAKNEDNDSGFDLEKGCDYVDVVGFTVNNAGTSKTGAGSITKAGIALAGTKGNRVIGNVVNGTAGIGGILVDFGTDVVVQGNDVSHVQGKDTTGHGMYVSGGSVGVQVLGNRIHDNAYVGIHVNGDVSEGPPGVVKTLLIAGNVIHGNGQNGINADGIESSTIENNVIYGNSHDGIELYQIDALGGSTGNVIVNNTIDQSMTAGSYAISVDACAYDNQGSAPTPAGCAAKPYDTSTANIAFDNVLLGGSGGGATSVVSSADLALGKNLATASPGLFAGAASGNYELAPGGPGIGAGVASFSGASAPATSSGGYDIGAFAFAP
jgi:hypothetical protein